MKRLSLNLLTNVLLLLVGIVLIIFYTQNDVLRWVSVVMGALFLLPSLAYLASVAFRAAEQRRPIDMLGILPSVGGMCFGVIMMLKPHLFENVIILLMGILMLVMGLFHIIYLLLSSWWRFPASRSPRWLPSAWGSGSSCWIRIPRSPYPPGSR